jgi:peptidoglycan hydrolase-like protein with peptidoglycan-binding domain
MDRETMKTLFIWIMAAIIAVILGLLLIDYLAPVRAADINNDQDIMEAQTRLAELGYDTGYTDGINGPATERALKQYQIDHGLKPTGTLNGKTWVLLNSRYGDDPGSGSGGSGFAGPVDLKCLGKECRH